MSDVEISRNKQTDSNNQKLNTQIQHTALRKKVSCYHYLIKSFDNLNPFLQLFKEMEVGNSLL